MSDAPIAILFAFELEDTKTIIVDLWWSAFISYSADGYTKQYYL